MSTEWTAVQRPNVWQATQTVEGGRVKQAGYVGPAGASGVPDPGDRPDVTGSRTDGTALASLLTALVSLGFITDSTTA